MPESHALVTASGAYRWMQCTPSARLESRFPDSSSEAAAEGTLAHALAEKKLRSWERTHRRSAIKNEDGTMTEATDDYRDYIIQIYNELKKAGKNPHLKVEVRLDLSSWIPEGFGTSDAVIVANDTLHVIDFKYGKAVKVDAPGNPQMRLYALGALDLYGDIFEFESVKTHIFQPRISEHISTEEISVTDLQAWGESIKPLAQAAYEGTGEKHAGAWCQFCRCKAVCRTRAEKMFAVLKDQKPSDTLSIEEVAEYLPKLDEAIGWAKSLQEYALQQAKDGQSIPGYKLVEGSSARKITDPEKLAEALAGNGMPEEKIWCPRKLQTLTALEKTVGKKAFGESYSEFITKPKGKPVLVPESDGRKPLQISAEEMFGKGEI